MLKILGRKSSSNVQKVLWCCGEIGLPFERDDIGGEFGGNKTPEYLALNPKFFDPPMYDRFRDVPANSIMIVIARRANVSEIKIQIQSKYVANPGLRE